MSGSTKLRQPLKWWGGKHFLADRIIDLMPPHLHYVEPFGGGLAVLLNKDPFDPRHQFGSTNLEMGTSEVVNDQHGSLQNFWHVLQHEDSFNQFSNRLEATPFSEIEFAEAVDHEPQLPLDVEAAVRFFVRCRQSRTGAFKDFTSISRNRTRRRMNEQASAWWTAVDGLAAVHDRLKRVVILCRDAIDVIRQQNGAKTLFYLDPPYVHSARASTGQYACEMSDTGHERLLEAILQCEAKVMLSGYPNPLYDNRLSQWNRRDFPIDNKAAGGKTKRIMTESVWCNF